MNLRVVIMLTCISLLTMAVMRTNSAIDPTNYVEYQASHGGSTWRGRAPVDHSVLAVEGERLELKAVIKPERFNSGNLMRDGLASATVFESKSHPDIVFTSSVNASVLHNDVQQIPLIGTLAMHGITKEIAAPVNLERNKTRLLVTGTLEVKLSDYQMMRPSVAGFPINDSVVVKFNIELRATWRSFVLLMTRIQTLE
jgi:polyisoprenoid-binding protein YceI